MQCALGWVPSGTLVIAWRGTANFRNVLTDIKFFSRKVVTTPPCRNRSTLTAAMISACRPAAVLNLGLLYSVGQHDLS